MAWRIRNILQQSVCALVSLAIISFALIFIISITLIQNLNDKIVEFTPLTMKNYTTWGVVPGDLNYTYEKSFHLFSINSVNDDTGYIDLKPIGPLNYSVSRTFVDPVYDDASQVVNYTMMHNYTLINTEKQIDQNKVNMFNLDGEAVWYQMNMNRPTFYKAWQAQVLASTTMLNSEMLSNFYAYQAYEYLFSD